MPESREVNSIPMTRYSKALLLITLSPAACLAQPASTGATLPNDFDPLTNGDGIRYPLVAAPVIWRTNGDVIHPVQGTDGRSYLAFEALITNTSDFNVTLTSFDVVDPAKGNAATGVNRVTGYMNQDVTGRIRNIAVPPSLDGSNYSAELEAGKSGVVYFSVSYPDVQQVPRRISQRVKVVRKDRAATEYVVISAPQTVSCTPALVLSPPLKGERWLNANGCCTTVGPHREVMMPVNGSLKAPERYAIDWVQLTPDGKLLTGPVDQLSSYPFYGAEVVAAASGTVVEVMRDLPNAVPGKNPEGITVETAGGNHVIVDMGNSHYAVYAHLQPNSTPWRVGDFVRTGELIGLLGNSGNTDAPHLHFHVSDRPSVLDGNGLPYVFDTQILQSTTALAPVPLFDTLLEGNSLPVQTIAGGFRARAMPLAGDVLSFVRSTTAVASPRNLSTVQREVRLDGSASTSYDGKPLMYRWSSPDGRASLSQADSATPVVQLNSGMGTYNIELRVTDARGNVSTDRIQISYVGN